MLDDREAEIGRQTDILRGRGVRQTEILRGRDRVRQTDILRGRDM